MSKKETGPVYNVELIDDLPLNYKEPDGMRQVMPSRADLEGVESCRARVVAGYEVLLSHWRAQATEIERLKAIVDKAIAWRKSFTHGRDITDEGYSVADEEAEGTLYEAVEAAEAAEGGG